MSFLIPLRISVAWQQPSTNGEDGVIQNVQIALLHWPHTKMRIPYNQKRSDCGRRERIKRKRRWSSIRALFRPQDFAAAFLRRKRRLSMERFTLRLTFGTGDAMQTALLTSAAWSTLYAVIGATNRWIRWLEKPRIHIDPVFAGNHFSGEFYCIFRVYPGDIIVAALATLRKGVKRSWNTRFKA